MQNVVNFLNNDWSTVGTDLKSLAEAVSFMDGHTGVLKMDSYDFKVMHTIKIENGKLHYIVIDEDAINLLQNGKNIAEKPPVPVKLFDEEKLNEVMTTTNLIFKLESNVEPKQTNPRRVYIYVSPDTYLTMLQRADLGGGTPATGTLLANAVIAYGLFRNAKSEKNMTYRVDEKGNRKAFALNGKRYSRLKQEFLVQLLSNLEGSDGAKCVAWEMDHRITKGLLVFPQLAKEAKLLFEAAADIMPVIKFASSDVAASSFAAQSGYLINNCYVKTGEFEQRHETTNKKEINVTALTEKVEKNLLAEPRKLPDCLTELYSIKIDKVQAILLFEEIWEKFKKEVGGFKTKNSSVHDKCLSELQALNIVTAYHVAIEFLTIEAKLSDPLGDTNKAKLYTYIGKIAFDMQKKLVKSQPQLTLISKSKASA